MPNSVLAPVPTMVLPRMLAIAFQQSRTLLVDENRYRDGSLQSRALATSSRKSWTLAARLSVAQLTVLRTFYNDRTGGWLEFYAYDPYETVPMFSYDSTGGATAGRYIGIFEGPLNHALDLGRNPASFKIIEIG